MSDRLRGGKIRYVSTTTPEDYLADLGEINPSQISLTGLADAFGSDKGSIKHNYCTIYENIINNLTNNKRLDASLDLLEIGVACGSSIRSWSHFLPKSNIIGIDIRPECRSVCRDLKNADIKIGDATKKEDCEQQLEGKKFDFIIDDGTHASEHILASFQILWDKVKSGGYYAIEDLACTYNEKYTRDINQSYGLNLQNKRTVFMALVDQIMRACDSKRSTILGFEYYPQLLVVKKR